MSRIKLKRWLKARKATQTEAATWLHCDQSTISAILSGRRSPGLALALEIERITAGEVSAASWVVAKKSRPVAVSLRPR